MASRVEEEATSNGDGGQEQQQQKPPLMTLNHVSRLCRSVKDSIEFYTKVLGFVEMERPEAFNFEGAWLFNYGVGIHLVQAQEEEERISPTDDPNHLDPMDNHISFQCEDMVAIEEKLKAHNIKYTKRTVGDDGDSKIDQLFFNDPHGFMIEICNCENIKLVPQEGSMGKIRLLPNQHNPPVELNNISGHNKQD